MAERRFLVARNPDPGSTLPYLLRLPVGEGIVLKAKETWPRTAKVYCHRAEQWPEDPEIVEDRCGGGARPRPPGPGAVVPPARRGHRSGPRPGP